MLMSSVWSVWDTNQSDSKLRIELLYLNLVHESRNVRVSLETLDWDTDLADCFSLSSWSTGKLKYGLTNGFRATSRMSHLFGFSTFGSEWKQTCSTSELESVVIVVVVVLALPLLSQLRVLPEWVRTNPGITYANAELPAKLLVEWCWWSKSDW